MKCLFGEREMIWVLWNQVKQSKLCSKRHFFLSFKSAKSGSRYSTETFEMIWQKSIDTTTVLPIHAKLKRKSSEIRIIPSNKTLAVFFKICFGKSSFTLSVRPFTSSCARGMEKYYVFSPMPYKRLICIAKRIIFVICQPIYQITCHFIQAPSFDFSTDFA